MRCPACGYNSREDRKFCSECGAPLGRRCPHCDTPNEPRERFCGECGTALAESDKRKAEWTHPDPRTLNPEPRSYTPRHLAEKILNSRPALEGERKQVTVLFADVKGSMELAEQVDPEEWHQILDRFFQILTDGVHRFEGTVNQYTGDGIMALFGAPLAHEDHAQRACYAALHLRDELRRYADQLRVEHGLSFSVRMGLNSGEVVVGKIGDDLRMDYTAQGHTVGLAARMEQLAEPGKALLTEYTAGLAAGYFALRDLGALTVKGVSEPLHVHELEGIGPVRTRLEISRARGFSRFVGRAAEMAALEAALAEAAQAKGRVVGVVADPGTGKSRLCLEFAERCRTRNLRVYESRAVAHGKMIPFLPVLGLLRAFFGVSEQDRPDEARKKIAGTLLLLDDAFRGALPLLFDFLGILDPAQPADRIDPQARQRQLFGVVKRLLETPDGPAPAVILIEDLHWIDGGTAAFLEAAIDALPGSPTLLLVNFRPEYHAGWMQKSYYQQLPLPALGPEASAHLLDDLLGNHVTLAKLRASILERTQGNPFFIEEVVQSLIESRHLEGARGAYRVVRPVDQPSIPAQVHAVLAARIDRLAEREKAVLQTAAVIGKEFAEPLLRRVVGADDTPGAAPLDAAELAAAIGLLTHGEFLYETALYPQAEYVFKHPLTQEVAYHSLLRFWRARVHSAVAQAITDLHPDKLDEHAALLAHHWEQAGDTLQAARCSRRAAARAGRSDPAEAFRHWRKVRGLAERLAEAPETLELRLTSRVQMLNAAWRVGVTEAEADVLFADLKLLAERSHDLVALTMATGSYAAIKLNLGKLKDFRDLACEEVRLADQKGDAAYSGGMRADVALAQVLLGRLSDAMATVEEARALLGGDSTAGLDVFGFSFSLQLTHLRAWALLLMGRLHETEAELAQAVDEAHERHESETLSWLHNAQVWLAHFSGDCEHALTRGRRAVELAEQAGIPFSRGYAYWSLGLAHLLNQDWAAAAAPLEAALSLGRERGLFRFWEPFILSALAEAYLGLGDYTVARDHATAAGALARQCSIRIQEIAAQLTLARVILRSDGAAAKTAVEAALQHTTELIEATGARAYAPFVHVERAALARLLGDEAGYQRELREAHRLFTEIGATGHAESISRQLSAVSPQPGEKAKEKRSRRKDQGRRGKK